MSKYTRNERRGQIIFVAAILLAIALGLGWYLADEADRTVKPDVVYPMTNVNISWQQTHHPGPWGSGD